MQLVVCIVPVSPMRKEAAHRSEMTNQFLFGELAEVLEEAGLFIHVRSLYDEYEGWCQKTQFSHIDHGYNTSNDPLTADWVNMLNFDGTPMQLSLGTPLAILNDGKADIGKHHIEYKGRIHDPLSAVFSMQMIKAVSSFYLNTGYLWGGRSVFGIDCSGFVQQVFRFFHKKLPRDAWQQAEKGEGVGFLQEVQCGDLAFFDNDEGRITHVGLLWDANTIIHASGKVRIDPIDTMGIVSSDTGERTHKLRVIKRYT